MKTLIIKFWEWSDDKRAGWAISIVAFCLSKLTPPQFREQIAEWAEAFAKGVRSKK